MDQSPLYAAIDLGSNSFHMLMVREVAGAIRTVAKVKRKVRLAAGLDTEHNLSHEAMARGWDCLRLFAEQLQDVPKENVRVVGTATLRLARNVDSFLRIAEQVLGHPIEIITGEDEARTIYQGVSWTSSGEGNRLVIDIGGASTELVIGESDDAKLLNSLHMGCVTWIKRYFPDGLLNEANFNAAIDAAKAVLQGVAQEYITLGWESCVGASGTVQALQEIMIAQGRSERVTLEKLYELKAQTISCGHLDMLVLQGLMPERLSVFPSGLAILIAIFEILLIDNMTLAGGALREGLIYGMIGKRRNCDVRERTADSLITRYQMDRIQAERVRDAALHAFQQVQKEWQLSEQYGRPMLRWAAMLHELGLCIEYKKAPQHAAYIIDNIDMPGFTPAQKQLLSALVFNQRDSFKLDVLEKQNAVSLRQATRLARLLRFAIILCMRRTEGSVPRFTMAATEDQLVLSLPRGWLNEHYLRASELQIEAERQRGMGWATEIRESDI
ncbi:guanosine-5'-triphosphate,3'-diphosphate diphosphatase [Tolumonas lignilytica]|uniref:guanosine-5'-triphosphate,3'-diphosphate diphosphatase n=1 Tax=Tolumonas lignilytica TaxID=1283284 RepID=UPI0004639AC7|nr:guanosine-5'-triphosphate,3'-diphosphate diphosphatase [Tolumonas lignilytica]